MLALFLVKNNQTNILLWCITVVVHFFSLNYYEVDEFNKIKIMEFFIKSNTQPCLGTESVCLVFEKIRLIFRIPHKHN